MGPAAATWWSCWNRSPRRRPTRPPSSTASIAAAFSPGRPSGSAAGFARSTWEAFWRTGVEGQDVRIVARSLGMTPGAVHIARSRVMARIRMEIEKIETTE